MTSARKSNPCQICAGDHKCSIGDGGLIICGRRSGDEPGFRYLGPSNGDPQFHLYRREGDYTTAAYQSKPSLPETESDRKWPEIAVDFATQFTLQQAQILAQRLALPVEVFQALSSIGYSSEEDFFAFPEVDAKGTVIGITRRFHDGQKKAIKGSKRGLSIPLGWQDRPGPVYLVEGPSDTLAMTAAGLSAIGRPSNTGGIALLVELLRDIPKDREIVVVGENDQKESGQWPGKDGAERVASALAEKLRRHIKIAFPPEQSKDVRAWLTADTHQGKPWKDRGSELSSQLQSVASTISPPPSDEPLVNPQATAQEDAERALLFQQRVGKHVRYVADWGCFVIFDGQRWLKNQDGGRVIDLARQAGDAMKAEALLLRSQAESEAMEIELRQSHGEAVSEDSRMEVKQRLFQAKSMLDRSKKWLNNKPVQEMLKFFKNLPGIRIETGRDTFDLHLHLLNVPNGTIDLRTGTLRSHDPEDFLTTLCPTAFNPKSEAPRFQRFMQELFPDKPATSSYLMRFSGYLLTGETTDQSFVLLSGDGSNGKTLLLEIWSKVVGSELSYHVPAEVLFESSGDRHPTERASFMGKRLAICSETEEEGALNEKRMKSLTGSDTVTSRFMRQDFFSFTPTHKLFLATNHKPRVRGTDDGIWRRFRLVMFERRFWKDSDRLANPEANYREADRADPGLKEMLEAEVKGILAVMVKHSVEFYANGRQVETPSEVMLAVAEYRKEEDIIGQFFENRVRQSDLRWLVASEFYQLFCEWSKRQGYSERYTIGIRKFTRMAQKRFRHKKISSSYYAVEVLPSWEEGRIESQFPVNAIQGNKWTWRSRPEDAAIQVRCQFADSAPLIMLEMRVTLFSGTVPIVPTDPML